MTRISMVTSSNPRVIPFLKSKVSVEVDEKERGGATCQEISDSKGAQTSKNSKETIIKGIFA